MDWRHKHVGDTLTWEHEELLNASRLVGEHLIRLVRSTVPSPKGDADKARFPPRKLSDFADDLLVLREELLRFRTLTSASFCMWKCFADIDAIGGNKGDWSLENWPDSVPIPLLSYTQPVPLESAVMSSKHDCLPRVLFTRPLSTSRRLECPGYSSFSILHTGGRSVMV